MAATLSLCVIVGTGFAALWRHEQIPGDRATAPDLWPAGSAVSAPSDRLRIVLFAHPFCPCVRSTLSELERLLAGRGHGCEARVSVVFHCPNSDPESWVKGDAWQRASRLPGVELVADAAGNEVRRFHAFTSGTILAYEPDGRRQFVGGITPSRGHEGDNAGADALAAVLEGRQPADAGCSVFGCPIVSPVP